MTLIAQEVADRTSQACEQIGISHSPIEVIQGDLLTLEAWYEADLIYIAAVCFSDEFMEKFTDLLLKTKKGTRVICMRPLPERDFIE